MIVTDSQSDKKINKNVVKICRMCRPSFECKKLWCKNVTALHGKYKDKERRKASQRNIPMLNLCQIQNKPEN